MLRAPNSGVPKRRLYPDLKQKELAQNSRPFVSRGYRFRLKGFFSGAWVAGPDLITSFAASFAAFAAFLADSIRSMIVIWSRNVPRLRYGAQVEFHP